MIDILVVGAGPVGLSLAIDLARHGIRCRIIDKALEPLLYCRAIGVTPRTLEVWERMGVARSMIEAGLWLTGLRSIINGQHAGDEPAPDFGLPYGNLGLPQYETERLLTADLARRGIRIERGVELADLDQDESGVTARLQSADGGSEEARFAYVVGCDGAHSAVRKRIGAEFEGEAMPWPFMLGDVSIDWNAGYGLAVRSLRLRDDGPPDMFIAIPLPERGRYRVSMLAPPHLAPAGAGHGIQSELPGPSLADLQAVADDLVPGAPKLSDLRWSSIYRISMRLASRYRDRRLFIAGDAAHIHPPTGGQGMNTGIQDAHNLAWKLALSLRGGSARLLDSYEAERRPVGAEVIARTRAASVNFGREERKIDARLVDSQVLVAYRNSPIVRDDLGADASGPRAGERAPDVAGLARPGFGFPLRLFDLLDGTEHVLLVRIGEDRDADIAELSRLAVALERDVPGAIRVVAVTTEDAPQQPALGILVDRTGAVAAAYGAAAAFVVRPDGHIGWRGASFRHPRLATYIALLRG